MNLNENAKLLFLDTETGGIDPLSHSLLSIGLVVWENGKLLSQKEILVNDGKLNTTKEALEINKIDIETHSSKALNSKSALKEIIKFISQNFENKKITIAGHNIHFDINFLRILFYKNKANYNDFFSHRVIDTSSILYFLYLSGKIKQKKVSSDEAFKYFNINFENRHSALGDALATAKLFNKLIELTK